MTTLDENAPTAAPSDAPVAVDAGERLPWMTRITYGLGAAAETVKTASFELFILFYYTQVLGLSPGLAGVAILIALIMDAVVDPAIGAWSDSIKKAPLGRRNTFMVAAIPPTALFMYLLFAPPEGMPQWALFAWLTGTAICMRSSISIFYVPYAALTPELTTLPSERATLAVIRSLSGVVMQFALIGIAFNVFFAASPAFENGQENPANYPPYALFIIVLITALILITAFGTRRRMAVVDAQAGRQGAPFSFANVIALWVDAFGRHANFRWLFLGSVAFFIMFSLTRSYGIYIGTYFFDLPPDRLGIWQQSALVGMLVPILAGTLIVKHWGTKGPFMASLVLLCLFMSIQVVLPLLGLFPDPAAMPGFAMLVAFQVLMGIGSGGLLILTNVMYAEVTDEFQFLTRRAQAGMLLGISWFGITAASGLGKLMAGTVLEVIGFPTGVTADQIPDAAVTDLAWAYVAIGIGLGGLGIAFFSRYHLPRQRFREIAAALGRPLPD